MADTATPDEFANAAKDEIAKAMNQAMSSLNNLNEEQATEGQREIDGVIYDEVPLYEEPLQDPYGKAIKYLEQHDILQLFQVPYCTNKLIKEVLTLFSLNLIIVS